MQKYEISTVNVNAPCFAELLSKINHGCCPRQVMSYGFDFSEDEVHLTIPHSDASNSQPARLVSNGNCRVHSTYTHTHTCTHTHTYTHTHFVSWHCVP